MLNYNEHDDSEEYVYSCDNRMADSHVLNQASVDVLEDYLDRVCAPLVGRLARNKREEIRTRVRLRLEQFAAAHRELGSTAAESIELALAQCGDPQLLSRRWLPEQTGARQSSRSTGLLRTKLSDRLLGSAKWATAVSTVTFGLPYLAYITGTSDTWWRLHSDNWVPYYRIFMFAVPLVAGIITGLAARNKPTRGVTNAIAILAVPALVLPGLLAGLAYANVFVSQSGSGFLLIAMPAVCGLVPWLTMGSAGAGLGRRLRNVGSRFASRAARVLRIRKRELVTCKINTSTTKTWRTSIQSVMNR